jgi:hypothetical protein
VHVGSPVRTCIVASMSLPVVPRARQATLYDYVRSKTPENGRALLVNLDAQPRPIQAPLQQPILLPARRRRVIDSDDEPAVATAPAVVPVIGNASALPAVDADANGLPRSSLQSPSVAAGCICACHGTQIAPAQRISVAVQVDIVLPQVPAPKTVVNART